MDIQFTCAKGHRLRATQAMEGKTCICPVCKTRAVVPVTPRNRISDTGVMRILGDADISPLPEFGARQPRAEIKRCPKCRKQLADSATICDNCKLYVDVTEKVWEKYLRASEG